AAGADQSSLGIIAEEGVSAVDKPDRCQGMFAGRALVGDIGVLGVSLGTRDTDEMLSDCVVCVGNRLPVGLSDPTHAALGVVGEEELIAVRMSQAGEPAAGVARGDAIAVGILEGIQTAIGAEAQDRPVTLAERVGAVDPAQDILPGADLREGPVGLRCELP